MSERQLQGLRRAVLAEGGFEQVGVTLSMPVPRRQDVDVRIVSPRSRRIATR
ncbi:MAG TPA: hypothetical protein VHM31_21435 [Polyangia bacterium]|nr:hypothetical protein [Polyangia bacterium]